MTILERMRKEFSEKETELKEKCNAAREKIFAQNPISKELFEDIARNPIPYAIHKIEIMSFDSKTNKMQIMLEFQDNETCFLYLEISNISV